MIMRPIHFLALLLVAGAAAAPSPALAECGHYVVNGARLAEEHEQSQLQPLAPHTPAAPQPCTGPGCSQGRSQSDLPSLPAPVPAEEWACSTLPVMFLAEPVTRGDSETHLLRPQRLARDLDPPPRANSLG